MFGFSKIAAKSDWEAFENEALPHLEDLFRIANWLVRDLTEAEDLVQETFTQAMRSFHRYELGTNCRAWLTTIMYHLNGKRRMKLGRLKMVEDTEEKIAQTIAFEPQLPQNITDEEILQALERIPQSFREIVLLSDVEEFAYKEIAEMLKIPIGTVMSRLHRGRKLLRVELSGYARDYGFKNADAKGK